MASVHFGAPNSVVGGNAVGGMSSVEIIEALRGMNSTQIESISKIIAQKVLGSLGPVNKKRIDTIVEGVKGVPEDYEAGVVRTRTHAEAQKALKEGQSLFPSDEKNRKFVESLWQQTQNVLAVAFSFPHLFYEKGHTFVLTNYFPRGLLRLAFEKNKITHMLTQYSDNYKILLQVDVVQSETQQCLVFRLTQTSQGVEFENGTFQLPN